MQSDEYLKGALQTESVVELQLDPTQSRLLHAAMGAATEAGELVDQMKRHLFYRTELDTINVVEEFGDILWYVAIGLDACGSDFETAMQLNHDKLESRYPERFDSTCAIERDLVKEREILEGD